MMETLSSVINVFRFHCKQLYTFFIYKDILFCYRVDSESEDSDGSDSADSRSRSPKLKERYRSRSRSRSPKRNERYRSRSRSPKRNKSQRYESRSPRRHEEKSKSHKNQYRDSSASSDAGSSDDERFKQREKTKFQNIELSKEERRYSTYMYIKTRIFIELGIGMRQPHSDIG